MEEFHASSVVLPLGKYHSTSTIASSRLRLAAVQGRAVYPQSCRRERFAARRRRQRQENLPERSERTTFGLDPDKSGAKPVRDREDGRIDSITIVPLQQHLVAAKFVSGWSGYGRTGTDFGLRPEGDVPLISIGRDP